MLAGQIEHAKAISARNSNGFQAGIMLGGPQEPELVPLEHVDVSIGSGTMIQIALIALLLASLATTAAGAKVAKYEPMKILMERD